MELFSCIARLEKGLLRMRYDKNARQRLIQDIIRQDVIRTQEELTVRLARHGVAATQATVSRDIKDLGLIKIPYLDGHRYAVPNQDEVAGAQDRLTRVLREVLVNVQVSENLVVVKTLSGGADVVSEAIDRQEWPDVVGTLAGDNTVMVVARERDSAPLIAQRLLSLG